MLVTKDMDCEGEGGGVHIFVAGVRASPYLYISLFFKRTIITTVIVL